MATVAEASHAHVSAVAVTVSEASHAHIICVAEAGHARVIVGIAICNADNIRARLHGLC